MGGVDYTNSIPKSVTNGRMGRRTDRQGQILMPPDYRHGGIKIKCRLLQFLFGALRVKYSSKECQVGNWKSHK